MNDLDVKAVLQEQLRILAEIRADLRAMEAHQIRLVESLTSLTKDALTQARPGATIQVGGFVLAVTLLLLNLLGLRVTAGKNGLPIETNDDGRSVVENAHP